MASISIYLNSEGEEARDQDLKKMIRDLKKQDGKTNRYSGRSESEIAKMILQDGLIKEHRKICGKSKK
jgi:hypothetical protein